MVGSRFRTLVKALVILALATVLPLGSALATQTRKAPSYQPHPGPIAVCPEVPRR